MKPVRPASMLRAAVISILVALAGGVVAAPAQAAAYRSWGYYHLENGAWAFSQSGSGQTVPADGSVEGWRFAVTGDSSARPPRALLTFDTLCAGTATKAATKRVGLVIDFGRPVDSADGAAPPAPRATCVAVPKNATGSDVLVAAGARLRLDQALICGIDGWPATKCSEIVSSVPAAAASPDTSIAIAPPKANAAANPAAQSTDHDSTSSRALALGAGAVVLIAALGLVAWRRSRDVTDG